MDFVNIHALYNDPNGLRKKKKKKQSEKKKKNQQVTNQRLRNWCRYQILGPGEKETVNKGKKKPGGK